MGAAKMFYQQGFNLIELLIVMAIVAILGAVAIPAYNSFIDESAVSAARGNLDTMRVFVEENRLENSQLPATGNYTNANIDDLVGWTNETVGVTHDYTLSTDQAADIYHIYVVARNQNDSNGNPIWVRCENNYQTCCTSLDLGAVGAAAACP